MPRSVNPLLLSLSVCFVTGCSIGNLAPPLPTPGTSLSGSVFGGAQPISGAYVRLYAVGNTGNGSAATDILTGPLGSAPNAYATTGSDGSFQITGDYNCPSNPATPVYLAATSGDPGLGNGAVNPYIALVAALGPCNQLLAAGSSTHININEATTVAAVWALSPFIAPVAAIPVENIGNIGASGSNLAGITNAFATANQLIDTANSVSPNEAIASFASVESAKLYSLADILASCVNSGGIRSLNACPNLFTYSTTGYPTDTFAAAVEIIQNPSRNVGKLFGLIAPKPPFLGLASPPNDWTMTIRYSLSDGPLNAFRMGGIDAVGNLVGVGSSNSGNDLTLASFNRQFTQLLNVPVCPDSNGYCYGTQTIDNGLAIDSSGDIWADTVYVALGSPTGTQQGSFNVTEFSPSGGVVSPAAGEPVGASVNGANATAQAIAADTNGAVWVGSWGDSGGNVALLNSGGTLLSPLEGYESTSGISPINIAIDSNHNAWVASWSYANEAGKNVSYPYITSIANAALTTTSAASPTVTRYNIASPVTYAIAVDTSNDVWFTSGPSQAAGFNNLGYITSTGAVGATSLNGGGLVNGVSMAADPGNHVWVANYNPTSYLLTLSEFSSASGSLGTALSPSTGYGLDTGAASAYVIQNIPGLIIDSSGSIWLPNTYQDNPGQEYLNTNYPFITVFVGLATPTQTPLLGTPQAP